MAGLKDSGDRTQFGDGALRDMEIGKGRCDLLPLAVVSDYLNNDQFLLNIGQAREHTNLAEYYIKKALNHFCNIAYDGNPYKMILEVSKHYEDGLQKYSAYNWKKGMPTWIFIDSGIRHYLKWKAGITDEPHDRAVVWNLLGAWWYIIYRNGVETIWQE